MVHEPSVALRVGLAGAAADADVGPVLALLERLATGLPPSDDPRLLRLLCQGSAPAEASILRAAETAGWTAHRVTGLAIERAPAKTLVLDGSPADPVAASAAAGGIIARNCDVLIAVGDAHAEPLAGLVGQAAALGVPVMWLAPGQAGRLLLDRGWRVALDPALEGEEAWRWLGQNVRAMLEPPADAPPAVATRGQDVRLPDRWPWRLHRAAMRLLWRPPAGAETAPPPSEYWVELFAASDALADGYADRYRSSYTIVLALAALALAAAVLGLGLPVNPLWTALPEAACLAGIAGIVVANERLDWRSRLIACRLLAELCRKQAALSLLARSLPATYIARLTHEGELRWVGWRFAAAVRAAPLPCGVLSGAGLAAARDAAAAVLMRGQRAYHATRAEAGRRREARLVWLGGAAFVLTVACVLIKLALLSAGSEQAETFGLIAALLPVLAAALFGLRAYAELVLLVQQSERTIAVLDSAARSLARTDVERPLASQHIGDVLEEAATAMLADVEGWIQISRVKAVEAG